MEHRFCWISPDGKYINDCGYFGHMSAAHKIMERFYPDVKVRCDDEYLIYNGWIKVESGKYFVEQRTISDEKIKLLHDLEKEFSIKPEDVLLNVDGQLYRYPDYSLMEFNQQISNKNLCIGCERYSKIYQSITFKLKNKDKVHLYSSSNYNFCTVCGKFISRWGKEIDYKEKSTEDCKKCFHGGINEVILSYDIPSTEIKKINIPYNYCPICGKKIRKSDYKT